jgi:hypothetical protein
MGIDAGRDSAWRHDTNGMVAPLVSAVLLLQSIADSGHSEAGVTHVRVNGDGAQRGGVRN